MLGGTTCARDYHMLQPMQMPVLHSSPQWQTESLDSLEVGACKHQYPWTLSAVAPHDAYSVWTNIPPLDRPLMMMMMMMIVTFAKCKARIVRRMFMARRTLTTWNCLHCRSSALFHTHAGFEVPHCCYWLYYLLNDCDNFFQIGAFW